MKSTSQGTLPIFTTETMTASFAPLAVGETSPAQIATVVLLIRQLDNRPTAISLVLGPFLLWGNDIAQFRAVTSSKLLRPFRVHYSRLRTVNALLDGENEIGVDTAGHVPTMTVPKSFFMAFGLYGPCN